MNVGKIDLAVGPMFSGKTEWLIHNLKQQQDRNRYVMAIKFVQDTRYSQNDIVSHNQLSFPALNASSVSEIEKHVKKNSKIEVLGIDEIQFFDASLISFIKSMRDHGMRIYGSGLDFDYKKVPWKTVLELAKVADSIKHLKAICAVCNKKTAVYSSRVEKKSERIVIGGADLYSPRCLYHFV